MNWSANSLAFIVKPLGVFLSNRFLVFVRSWQALWQKNESLVILIKSSSRLCRLMCGDGSASPKAHPLGQGSAPGAGLCPNAAD
jgi:hypothetical protein